MHTIENTKAPFLQRLTLYYIRPIAALWLLALGALSVAYYFAFGDYHAKLLLEKILSQIHGTVVTVGSVRVSLAKGQVTADNIQIGHPVIHAKNLYEIKTLDAQFNLTPLIRKQFIFPKVELHGIRYLSPRNTFQEGSEKPFFETSLPVFDKLSSNLFSTLNLDFARNPLKHLAQLSTGLHTKELINSRYPQLESAITIDFVQRELAKTENVLERNGAAHLDHNLSALLERKHLIEKAQSDLRSKLATLDETIQKDTLFIRKELGLPESDSESFAPVIFGPRALNLLEQSGQWVDFFRRKMPVRMGSLEKSYTLQQRERGSSVNFPYRAGHPNALIQNLEIHSVDDPSAGTGFVEGKITGLASSPYIFGKPAEGSIRFSFPSQGIENASIHMEMDHVGEEPKEHFTLDIESLTLKNSEISKNTDLSLLIARGNASLKIIMDFQANALKASGTFKSKETEFSVSSPFKKIEDYIQSLLVPFYQFELNAKIEGSFDNLKLTLDSSLDRKVTSGLNDEIKRQISAIDETIRQNLSNQIMPKKHSFLERLDKINRVDLETIAHEIERRQKADLSRKTSRNEHLSEPLEMQ